MMTESEAFEKILATTPLTAQDMEILKRCNYDEILAIATAYRDAGVIPNRSTWEEILSVLQQVSSFASMISPIVSVVSVLFPLL